LSGGEIRRRDARPLGERFPVDLNMSQPLSWPGLAGEELARLHMTAPEFQRTIEKLLTIPCFGVFK
jgi:hypothetical protein